MAAKNPILVMSQVQTGVVKSPLFETEECRCLLYAMNPSFYNMVVTFVCQFHGTVTIDRRPPMFTMPIVTDPQPFPKWGVPQPAWTSGGITTAKVNGVGVAMSANNKEG